MKKYQLTSIALLSTALLLNSTVSLAENVGDYNYNSGYSTRSYNKSGCNTGYKNGYSSTAHYKGEITPYNAPCRNNGLHDGIYVGLQGGYDTYRFRSVINTTDGLGNTISSNPALNVGGIVGGVFFGAGRYFDCFYLAAEAIANASNAITSYTTNFKYSGFTDNYYTQIRVRPSYGIAVLPGFRMNDNALLYGRLGWTVASIRTYENFSTVGVTTTIASRNLYRSGGTLGLGIESALVDDFSIRAEYSYTRYATLTSVLGTKFYPSDNQVMLGVLYRFC